MKKTYISPATTETILSSSPIMAPGSLVLNENGGQATPFNVDAEGDALSRRHSNVWLDEEDEQADF